MSLLMMLAAATIASQGAQAAGDERLPDVSVDFSDLDLSTPAGVKALNRRLTAAINAACPSDEGVRDLSRTLLTTKCRAEKRAEIAPLRAAAIERAGRRQAARP